MRRAAAWMVFLLLVLGALLAAWFLPTRQPAAPVAPPPAVPAKAPAPVVVPAAPAAPAEPTREPDAFPQSSEPRLERWLEGTVRLEDGTPAAGARIQATALHEGRSVIRVKGEAAPDGTFRLDVTPRGDHPKTLEHLRVKFDHPDATFDTRSVTVPPEALDRDQPAVRIPLDLVLPRAVVVSGRVVDARGAPVRGAEVISIWGDQKHFALVELDSTVSGPDGKYRLRVPAAKKCQLGAGFADRIPAFLEWPGGGGAAADLVLEDAMSISGRVTDAAGLPVAGATVQAEKADEHGPGHRSRFRMLIEGIGNPSRVWCGTWIGAEGAEAPSTADGSFTITGLEPAKYHVSIAGLQGEQALADVFRETVRTVDAPATGVGLRLDPARVRFEVRLDGEVPPRGARLMVESRHRTLVRENVDLSADGSVEVLALPGATYEIDLVGAQQHLDARRIQVPEGARSAVIRLDFERPEPRSSLVVILSSPSRTPALTGFGFFDLDDEEANAPAIRRDAELVDGRYLLTELRPGRWRVVIRPGGPWLGGEAFFLEEAVDVELPPRGRAEVRVALRTGGRIRIDARDREGQPVDAKCEIVDGAGRAVPASFQMTFESVGSVAKTGGLVPRGENLVVPALPEGTYTLRFGGEGWVEKSETVTVRAGETTKVAVVLERTR